MGKNPSSPPPRILATKSRQRPQWCQSLLQGQHVIAGHLPSSTPKLTGEDSIGVEQLAGWGSLTGSQEWGSQGLRHCLCEDTSGISKKDGTLRAGWRDEQAFHRVSPSRKDLT